MTSSAPVIDSISQIKKGIFRIKHRHERIWILNSHVAGNWIRASITLFNKKNGNRHKKSSCLISNKNSQFSSFIRRTRLHILWIYDDDRDVCDKLDDCVNWTFCSSCKICYHTCLMRKHTFDFSVELPLDDGSEKFESAKFGIETMNWKHKLRHRHHLRFDNFTIPETFPFGKPQWVGIKNEKTKQIS